MSFGMENATYNYTQNSTALSDLEGGIGELLANTFGGYELIGIVVLAAFAYTLYKARVDFDTGAVFMSVGMFVFGKFGLLPGGNGTLYGLILGVAGLMAAGIYRYLS